MVTWKDLLVEEQRRRDQIAKAAQIRNERHVLRPAQRQPSPYQRLLVGIGERLVVWGYRLQARYEGLAANAASSTLKQESLLNVQSPEAGTCS